MMRWIGAVVLAVTLTFGGSAAIDSAAAQRRGAKAASVEGDRSQRATIRIPALRRSSRMTVLIIMTGRNTYRPYPYLLPAPFPLGFGFGPWW